jgi:hypothetical protein
VFGHGSTVDQLIENTPATDSYNTEEFLADVFAGFLLMPKAAIHHAVNCRDWSFKSLSPWESYVLAGNFGVGYSTLVRHLQDSLELISPSKAEKLLQTQPKDIRESALVQSFNAQLFYVDHEWEGRPVDLEVGDLVLTELGIDVKSDQLRQLRETTEGILYRATAPGIGRLLEHDRGWATFVRVSRSCYEGRSQYRHLEEASFTQ